ncbi:MAG TPA: glycogen-binding domain-containing protein [Longimicrobiales bacterium]
MRRSRWPALLLLGGAVGSAPQLHAQTSASLAAGASFIEYDGYLATVAATFTPAVRVDARDLSFGAQGSWTVFESGSRILQANAGAAWLAPSRNHLRWELSAAGGASKYADEPGAGHLLGRSRLHLFAERYGTWLQASAGVSYDTATTTPFEIGVGAWTLHERFALVGTASAAWLDGDQHIDLTLSARWTPRRLEAEARIGARPWVNSPGFPGDATSGFWGEVSALVALSRQVSLALSGGSYPSDPVRRVLGADYFTAGVRIMLRGSEYTAPLATPDLETLLRRRRVEGSTTDIRIEIAESGVQHVVRVHAAGAHTVELMGDFTDWEVVALEPAGDGVWKFGLPLNRGVHRLNVRVDGGPWVVPAGARAETDEFGGVVGVIVVQ